MYLSVSVAAGARGAGPTGSDRKQLPSECGARGSSSGEDSGVWTQPYGRAASVLRQ